MIGFESKQAPQLYAALKAHQTNQPVKRWVYVPYDQLCDGLASPSTTPPRETGLILIESLAKGKRRPYHKQKLALILCNQRHFALEKARQGYRVHYVMTDRSYASVLEGLSKDFGPIDMMEAAEYELRSELAPLIAHHHLRVLPNTTWLTSESDFELGTKNKRPWRMDYFYQYLRRKTGLLMDNGKPCGGRYSLDGENRKPWKGEPPAPSPPSFEPEPIGLEVKALIESVFADNIGSVALERLPCTEEHAEQLWLWVQHNCLVHFGPYEDAMSTTSQTLFHSCLSPLINISRLTPKRIIDDVLLLELPLSSKEGFIRQILGWREFMRHVHRKTEGFRRIDSEDWSCDPSPCARWKHPSPPHSTADGGSQINALEYSTPLPPAFWGQESGLHCLDHVVKQVMDTGFTHHIPRLMVLANIATLLEIHPREITDWFWVSFIDAFDWVVEPNVLGMGTYATGPLFTTKPYIAGSNYINKMSDFCKSCAFNPKKNCPITRLYWAYLARNKAHFKGNIRMAMILKSLERRSPQDKSIDALIFQKVTQQLGSGQSLDPQHLTPQTAELQ